VTGFGGIDNEGSTNGSFGGRISGVANLADSDICCFTTLITVNFQKIKYSDM
jgi:hypothetical protein